MHAIFESERLLYRPFERGDETVLNRIYNEPSYRRWFYFLEPDSLTMAYAIHEVEKNMATWSRDVNPAIDACGLGLVLEKAGYRFTHAEKYVSVYEIEG